MATKTDLAVVCFVLLLPMTMASPTTATTTMMTTTTAMVTSTGPPPAPPRELLCTPEAAGCWARGGLWHGPTAACHTPLEQGPCDEGQWFVVNATHLPEGACVARPCPPGQLPKQGRCLEEAEAREMCWSSSVYLDEAGVPRCGNHSGWSALLAKRARCVNHTATAPHPAANHTTEHPHNFTVTNATDLHTNATDQPEAHANKSAVMLPGGVDCPHEDNELCTTPVISSGGAVAQLDHTFGLAVSYALLVMLKQIIVE